MYKGTGITLKQTSNYARTQRTGRYRSPYKWYFWLSMILTVAIAAFLNYLKLPVYLAYMLSLNSVLFSFYAYDKVQAKIGGRRIPELILHFLAVIGGPVGGIAGQWLFHHKVRKQGFHVVLWVSLVVHLAVFVLFYKFLLSFNDWQAVLTGLAQFFHSSPKR